MAQNLDGQIVADLLDIRLAFTRLESNNLQAEPLFK